MSEAFFDFINSIEFFRTMAFGIIAMVLAGASSCLPGFVMGDAPKRGIDPSMVQLFGGIFSLVFGLIILKSTGHISEASPRVTAIAMSVYFVAGALNFLMLQIMSYAMQRGPNGVIWCIIQSATVFPFIVGIVFFNVEFNFYRLIGIILLLAALATFASTRDNRPKELAGNWKLWAFIAMILVAIQQNLATAPSYFEEARKVSSITRSISAVSGTLFTAVIYNLVQMNGERFHKLVGNLKNKWLWIYVFTLKFFALFVSYTLVYPGMDAMATHRLGGMSYPIMVGSCITMFPLIGAVVLREKLTPRQILAITLCIAGLAGICLK